jgi:hypothetical protein
MELINKPPGAGRKRLARLMVINDISQRQLSRAAGWKSHTYLGRMLKGTVSTCEPEHAVKIARFLGVAVDDLFVAKVSSATGQNGKAA